MADLSGIMNFGVSMLAVLPQILFFVQIFIHISFLLFFGWIVMLGYRTYSSRLMRFLLRVGFGFAALICGMSLSGFIDLGVFGEISVFLKIAQFDIFFGGILSSIVLLASVYLISRNVFNIEGIKKQIERLNKRLNKAEGAKKIAGGERFKTPSMLIGIVLFACFLGFSLLNFHGYPSFSDRVFSEMGISSEELNSLIESARQSQNMTGGEECESVVKLLQENSDALTGGKLPAYTSPETRNIIETATGAKVIQMYSVESGGRDYVIAIMDNDNICSATEKALCSCFDYGGMI